MKWNLRTSVNRQNGRSESWHGKDGSCRCDIRPRRPCGVPGTNAPESLRSSRNDLAAKTKADILNGAAPLTIPIVFSPHVCRASSEIPWISPREVRSEGERRTQKQWTKTRYWWASFKRKDVFVQAAAVGHRGVRGRFENVLHACKQTQWGEKNTASTRFAVNRYAILTASKVPTASGSIGNNKGTIERQGADYVFFLSLSLPLPYGTSPHQT